MTDRKLPGRERDERNDDLPEPERGKGGHGIERVVVALDPSAHSMAALEAAVRMASRLEAELLGLFVEDVNVRRLADLSFVQEVGIFSATCRQVESQSLLRQLRVQVGTVRRRFQVITSTLRGRCTFREIRGRIVSEILGAVSQTDIVILGKGAWSAFETERLAPAVREVLGQLPSSTLVLRAGTHVEPPMRVVYDGTMLAQKALATALALLRTEDGHLMILLLADEADRASCWEKEIRQSLAERSLQLTFQQLTEASVSRLAYLVAHDERGTLVLPVGAGALEDQAVLDFLDETRAPVLIIR